MDPLLVILAGGISSRMRKPAASTKVVDAGLLKDADEKAKGMIGVGHGRRPFLDYLLWNAEAAGYRDVVLVIGERDDSTRDYYGRELCGNSFGALSISYALQPIPNGRIKPLGTADALTHALAARPDWAGKSFTVCNSDNLYSVSALRLLKETTYRGALIDYDRDALDFPEERIRQFAVIRKDPAGFLAGILEKPSAEELAGVADPSGRIGVSMNIFRLQYDLILPILERVPLHPVRQEKELPLAIRMFIEDHPRGIMTYPLSEHVPDLTSRDDIPAVQRYLREMFRLPGSQRP